MMNRRDWFKAAGAVGVSAAMPASLYTADAPAMGGNTVVKTELKRLMLRHTWTTTMSSSAYRDTVHLQYQRDGITGYGEGAPIVRYKEYPEQAKQAIDAIIDKIAAGDPRKFDKFLAEVRRLLGDHQHAAMAAVDIAVCDWLGKKLGIPLYQYFGLDPADAPRDNFFDWNRHAGDHPAEDARGGRFPCSEGEGRAQERRGDHRGRAQRHTETISRGCQ